MASDQDSEGVFPFGTRLGLAFTAESACCSALMVSGLLAYILYSTVAIKRGASRRWTADSHVHFYFVNLLVFDLVQAIGGLLDIKWVVQASVTNGPLCTAQGILKQAGDVGVALSSTIIALHTFCVLVLRRNASNQTAIFVLLTIWTFIALVIGITLATHKGKDYYGDTQYWCWITSNYGFQRIALEYFWLWCAAFINLTCYGVMAMVVKGALVVNGTRFRFITRKHRKRLSLGASNLTGTEKSQANAIARHMLFYPLIYILAVTPISVVRWMTFTGRDVPFSATAVASITFSSSGVFNVILYAVTRPKLLPHREHRSDVRPFSFSGSPRSIPRSSIEGSFSQIKPTELPLLHISHDRYSNSSV